MQEQSTVQSTVVSPLFGAAWTVSGRSGCGVAFTICRFCFTRYLFWAPIRHSTRSLPRSSGVSGRMDVMDFSLSVSTSRVTRPECIECACAEVQNGPAVPLTRSQRGQQIGNTAGVHYVPSESPSQTSLDTAARHDSDALRNENDSWGVRVTRRFTKYEPWGRHINVSVTVTRRCTQHKCPNSRR